MFKYFIPATALTAIVAAGVVYGQWTDRWGLSEAVATAATQIDRVPLKVGDWQAEPQESKSRGDLGVARQVDLHYQNTKTGDTISIALMCGRRGPISVHTPDVCYAASGFKVGKPSVIEVAGGKFYVADAVRTQAANKSTIRIFWSWRAGDQWATADNPRMAFWKEKVLFKFYVIRDLPAPISVEQDSCVEFLKAFLPEMERVFADG